MASEFQSFLEDLFAPVGGVRFRRMFGGLGIYRDGVMFALVADDVLHFKVDDSTRRAFEEKTAHRSLTRRAATGPSPS